MRLVLQRVSQASVEVEGEQVGSIGRGLLVLVGVAPGDGEAEVGAAADKLGDLRVFPDEEGKMNRSVIEAGGEVLVVSQFTLLADLARGRRPSFTGAAPPDQARHLIDALVGALAERGISSRAGRFGAHMRVSLVNDGPVTIVIDVKDGRVL